MATDKKISYINQDGYKNYIKNSDSVTIPKKFKARKEAASTHLAYITKAEAAQLKKQNKGTPHKGPKGIPSYDSFDAAGGYSNPGGAGDKGGYSASSGGGGGGWQDTSRADQRVNERAEQVRRNYVNKENIRSSYLHDRYDPNRIEGQNKLGGFFGGLGRGLLSIFGGIPGRVMSGILSARNLAQRTGAKIGEEVDEFSQYPTLDRYLNRNTDKYKDKPYRGQGQGYDFSDKGNNLGLYTDTLGAPIGPGKRVGQDQGYYGMGSQYDQTRMPSNITSNMGANNFNNAVPNNELFTDNNLMAFNPGSLLDQKINQAYNTYNETGFGQNNLEELMKMDIQNQEDTGNPLSLPQSAYTMFGADGGRAGYREGLLVDEDVNIQGPDFDVNENLMASGEGMPFMWEEFLAAKELDPGLTYNDFLNAIDRSPWDETSTPDQGIASLV